MEQCLSVEQMSYFLSLIEVTHTLVNNVLTVFATEGPVLWWFDGEEFCLMKGENL